MKKGFLCVLFLVCLTVFVKGQSNQLNDEARALERQYKTAQAVLKYEMSLKENPNQLTVIVRLVEIYCFELDEVNDDDKKKEQLKNDLDGNTQVFITTFLSMVYKAFDRETKLLLVVTQSSEGMTELKVTRNDVERPILLYNFCHSRFQNAAESVGKLISGKTFKHTLFIVDPPWGSTKDYEKPEWDLLRYKPFTGLLPVLPQYSTAQYSPLGQPDYIRQLQTESDWVRHLQTASRQSVQAFSSPVQVFST